MYVNASHTSLHGNLPQLNNINHGCVGKIQEHLTLIDTYPAWYDENFIFSVY